MDDHAVETTRSRLRFLADAQGRLLKMRGVLDNKDAPLDKTPILDIADTARQLALRADAEGFAQISAAADALEHTADLAQTRARLVGP